MTNVYFQVNAQHVPNTTVTIYLGYFIYLMSQYILK